jgi:putative multiple sugar transport system substrate-binding protein
VRKFMAVAAAATMVVGLGACGRQTDASTGSGSGSGNEKGTIGVAMPTKTSERWIKDGDYIKQQLEAAGYKVNLQYANDDIPTQVTQVNDMVTKKNKVLVVASIDGTALKGALKEAKDAGIPVIAYDRLLRDTEAVDYYTTFDNLKVGKLQGQSLLDGLAASGAPKPWNVELFAGSPDDNNATFFFNGAMEVLKPKIDDGTIKIASGETAFNKVATLRWDAAVAKKRMENVLTKSYSSADVNGVLAPYDGLSRGIIAALKGAGYGSGSKKLPVVTGQDAELESVKMILSGEQYSTVFKNTRDLAAATVKMIQEIADKKTVTVNDTSSYDNGVKKVPTMLLEPVSCDKTNVKDVLLKAKYYTEAELG